MYRMFSRNCNETKDSSCSYLNNFTDEELMYLETLGDLEEKNRYVMIIEYSEAKILGSDSLNNDSNIHNSYNYAWVRI